jgi:DnaJ-class molecular chaperone
LNNPYATLGVPPSATVEEVRQRYYELAKELHPDKGGDPEKFKIVLLANEDLTVRRQQTKRQWLMRPDLCKGCEGEGTTEISIGWAERRRILCIECNGTGVK